MPDTPDPIPRDEEAVKEKIAERIIEARNDCGMSRAELARRTKASDSAVMRWEKKENLPPLDQILKVANALNYSLAWFLQDFDPKIAMAEGLSEGIYPVTEAGDRAELSVRLKDLVQAAPSVQVLVSVAGEPQGRQTEVQLGMSEEGT